jgi:hypothetical protein
MEKIIIKGGHKTPYLFADPESGLVEIKGRSNPENSCECYRPLIEWLDIYSGAVKGNVNLTIDLEQFNTSSSKCLMDILKRLKTIREMNRAVAINWYYEADDEEMLEAAETYENMIGLQFTLISKPV